MNRHFDADASPAPQAPAAGPHEPVSSLERVRLAEIKAQREMEAEAAALAKSLFEGAFNTCNKAIELAAKHDLIRLAKD